MFKKALNSKLGRKLLVVAAVGAVAGVVVPVAGAHSGGTYYWSAVLAKHRLLNQDIVFDDGVTEDVIAAECRGEGRYIFNNDRSLRLFKHHVCAIVTAEGNTYIVRTHVLNRFDFRFNVLRVV